MAAPFIRIRVQGDEALAEALNQIAREARRKKRPLLTTLGRVIRTQVKKRITTSDGGSWAKPSKWTKAKKGRRKSLVGTGKLIRSKSSNRLVAIFAVVTGNWTMTDHHHGFIKPPTGNRVFLSLRKPSALNPNPGPSFSFISRRESVTPARRIWSNTAEVVTIINKHGIIWLRKVVAKGLAKTVTGRKL